MNLKQKLVAAGATVAALPMAAHAELPTEVSTALTAMGVDGKTAAGIVLVALVGILAIKFVRKGF